MNFALSKVPVEEILKLISRTATGRKVLEAFLPRYHQRRVRIEPYPPELLEKLHAALGPGQPVGACFLNDGETGSIHFDPTSAIGVLAPFLLHEMVHSLDESLWKAAHRTGSRKVRDQLMLQAETRAFEFQHRFVQELLERYPAYRTFLDDHYPKARVLHERLTGSDISELYGFDNAS